MQPSPLLSTSSQSVWGSLQVATCIGEEGLDIPDVDLIVCLDVSSSPTRSVQRMGRTGRHRAGRVVYILSEGAEQDKYRRGQQVRLSSCSCSHHAVSCSAVKPPPLGNRPFLGVSGSCSGPESTPAATHRSQGALCTSCSCTGSVEVDMPRSLAYAFSFRLLLESSVHMPCMHADHRAAP